MGRVVYSVILDAVVCGLLALARSYQHSYARIAVWAFGHRHCASHLNAAASPGLNLAS